ncbi:MAG: DNA-binding protein [Puniceicoccaceae bacterium 5H]|nr:MAG: DNA-binding protein [Puniceicoccaceae bacterium 5H]
MPRPPCPRRIDGRPPADYFKPAGIPLRQLEEVELAPEEWEALRLADVEQLYRAEAAERMDVSRQTFDRIVRKARAKVAGALLNGQALRLQRVEPRP